jgi:hypothetical protein
MLSAVPLFGEITQLEETKDDGVPGDDLPAVKVRRSAGTLGNVRERENLMGERRNRNYSLAPIKYPVVSPLLLNHSFRVLLFPAV